MDRVTVIDCRLCGCENSALKREAPVMAQGEFIRYEVESIKCTHWCSLQDTGTCGKRAEGV